MNAIVRKRIIAIEMKIKLVSTLKVLFIVSAWMDTLIKDHDVWVSTYYYHRSYSVPTAQILFTLSCHLSQTVITLCVSKYLSYKPFTKDKYYMAGTVREVRKDS